MKLRYLFFLFLLPSVILCQTSNISGIINSYVNVTSIGSQFVIVMSATGFNINDRVLLIQMKGATINTTNTSAFGTILNYNNAGNYEFATITSIAGSTITFANPIIRTYSPSDFVQLVKVPTYTNVVINGLLTCLPWNGTIGGILVFEASGTITLNANIDVSGNGFLGGALSNGAITSCLGDTFDFVLPSTSLAAARKGEGIVDPNLSMADAKGAYANGGGGGNDCNAGGAGGGNYGLGGHGGDDKVNVSCPPFYYENSGGHPGKNLQYSNSANKIFLGGGGGCGHQNDGAGTAGVSGGGIVIILGSSITGNNYYIKSNGSDNNIIAGIDGQGGGGAGGTVLLDACAINSLNVSVTGGKGGVDNFTGSDCHGKGGGGAGGIIWVSSSIAGITAFLTGGLPGVFTSPGSLCYGTSNGATAGEVGGTLTGLVIPGASALSNSSHIIDTSVCLNSAVQLSAPTAASYTWSTGSNSSSISIASAGTYWVQALQSNGCLGVDTFKVKLILLSQYDVLRDTSVCAASSFSLNASASHASSYTWSDGTHNSSTTINNSGIYWVDMQIDQCTVRDSAKISLVKQPVINITRDTSLCLNPIVLQIKNPIGVITWSNGSHLNQITVTNPGIYYVSLSDSGCTNKDSINVKQIPGINSLIIPNIFTPNGDGLNDFFELTNSNLIIVKEFTIYNRWGKAVYSITNSVVKWDGRQNGNIIDDDTYFWVGIFNDLCDPSKKDNKQRGVITIVK